MKSVVINAGGSVSVEEKAMPQLESADDVLVKVCCSGLCGSDIPRIFHNGAHFTLLLWGTNSAASYRKPVLLYAI